MAKPTGLSAKQVRLLGELNSVAALDDFYLAGGSAVGWLFHHRRSLDLDLFSTSAKASLSRVVSGLTGLGAQVVGETDVAVKFEASGVPVDVVRYPYAPLKRPAPGPAGFRVASAMDLAVMKLAAIARRGLRRDFWDLHVLIAKGKLDLPAILKAYQRRYGRSASDSYHVARALAFFDDAERDDPRLVGLSPSQWGRIKGFFREQAAALMLR